jgi:hypothetical protein
VAVLGLILLVAAGVLTAAVVASNTSMLSVDLWSVSVSNVTLGVVFVAGMITTVLAVVGLGLLMGGLRRGRRIRQERRALRRENEQLARRTEPTGPADDYAGRSAPLPPGPPVQPRLDLDGTRGAPASPRVPPASASPATGPQQAGTRPLEEGTNSSRRRSFLPHRDSRVGTDSNT